MKKLVLTFTLAAGIAHAQETQSILLQATYIGEPTDWCAADEGVPVIVNFTVPNIVKVTDDFPKWVDEMRGGAGDRTRKAIFSTFKIQDDAPVIGTYSAEFLGCQTPWKLLELAGRWSVIGQEEANVVSGYAEKVYLKYFDFAPLEQSYSNGDILKSRLHVGKLGNDFLLMAGPSTSVWAHKFKPRLQEEDDQ